MAAPGRRSSESDSGVGPGPGNGVDGGERRAEQDCEQQRRHEPGRAPPPPERDGEREKRSGRRRGRIPHRPRECAGAPRSCQRALSRRNPSGRFHALAPPHAHRQDAHRPRLGRARGVQRRRPRRARRRTAPMRRGLWVLAEGSQRVLEHPDRIPGLISTARGPRRDRPLRAGLPRRPRLVRVEPRGRLAASERRATPRAPTRSRCCCATPTPRACGCTPGSTCSRSRRIATRRCCAISAATPCWSTSAGARCSTTRISRCRRRTGAYYRMGTPGLYLDPAASAWRSGWSPPSRSCVARYPELDGLHLDYIRYPDVLPFTPGSRFGVGLDFGYARADARALSRRDRARGAGAEIAARTPTPGTPGGATRSRPWSRRSAPRRAPSSPELELSAAVIPYADRAYLACSRIGGAGSRTGCSSSRCRWPTRSTIACCATRPRPSPALPRRPHLARARHLALRGRARARARADPDRARRRGDRDALFSYDAIAEAPDLAQALARPVATRAVDGSRGLRLRAAARPDRAATDTGARRCAPARPGAHARRRSGTPPCAICPSCCNRATCWCATRRACCPRACAATSRPAARPRRCCSAPCPAHRAAFARCCA